MTTEYLRSVDSNVGSSTTSMASGMQGSLLLILEGLISGQKTIIIKNRRRMPCGGMVDDGNAVLA